MTEFTPNTFIQNLAAICRENLLAEKWLLAPNRRVGNQWVEQVARSGQPAVNLRVTTPMGLALHIVSAGGNSELRLLSRTGLEMLIGQLWSPMVESVQDPYLASANITEGLLSQLASTINDLRMDGTLPGSLDPVRFEVRAKGVELGTLYDSYCEVLQEKGLFDIAAVFSQARQILSDNPNLLPPTTLLLVPESVQMTTVERGLIENIPASSVLSIGQDSPQIPYSSASDAGWEIFSAIGEANEIREVFRRCLRSHISLDQVEIIVTDPGTYISLVFEESVRLTAPYINDPSSPPMTFAEGIPTRLTRPGRAIMAWVDWIAEGYPQPLLVRALRGGILELGSNSMSISRAALLLRGLPIGKGKERYLPAMEDRIRTLENRLSRENSTRDETGRSEVKKDINTLRSLSQFVEQLFKFTPGAGSDPLQTLEACSRFLAEGVRKDNRWDNYAAEAFAERITDLRYWIEPKPDSETDTGTGSKTDFYTPDILSWLRSMAQNERVGGSGPRPGCLHISSIISGGHTGRPHTYIVGLDDSRHPGAGLQDPVFLDQERARISPDLPTAAGRLSLKTEQTRRLLAGLSGKVTLSWTSKDLAEGREIFPSGTVLDLYRVLSSKPDADLGDLTAALPPPAAFAPGDPQGCLDEAEWWINRLCKDPPGKNPPEDTMTSVRERYPNLASGAIATGKRLGEELTEFDGLVSLLIDDDPMNAEGPVMSASRMETIGRCPLAYFFKYLVGLETPDEPAEERQVWLEPLEFGSLLHDILHRFMAGLMEVGEPADFDRDWPALVTVIREEAARYLKIHPPPNDLMFDNQMNRLMEAGGTFLADEAEDGTKRRPILLEEGMGMSAEEEPVSLQLPGGATIRARGRIDRIDRLPGEKNRFTITDYKSGGSGRFDTSDPFRGGRTIQHVIYFMLAEKHLKEHIGADASVEWFNYQFPASERSDEPVQYKREDLADGAQVLSQLAKVAASGAFCPTDDKKDCRWCDYTTLCGDVEKITAASASKIAANEKLAPFRSLRADPTGIDDE